MAAGITISSSELATIEAALSIVRKKLQVETGAVSTAPARKGKVQAPVGRSVEKRRQRYQQRQ